MRTRKQLVTLGAVLALALTATPARAQAADADLRDGYADGYAAGDYARLRHFDGSLTVRREAAESEPVVALNAPLLPGDTLATAPGERAEVELAGGTLVRLDGATELGLTALPTPYAGVQDNTVLRLAGGALRVQARVATDSEFRIDTPAASIYLLGDGDFRFDVDPSGRTRVASRRGVAEIAAGDASTLVRAGTLAEVEPSGLPGSAMAYNTFARDGFDRWSEERDAAAAAVNHAGSDAGSVEVYEELPREVRPYYRELSGAGSWTYLPDYGYAWYPRYVGVGWRPYLSGSWYYGTSGYFWVGAEPWGWAPYRYGRWVWAAPHGWCWVPGAVFGGAWVAWSWGPSYVGWAPLDYWNRPAFYGRIHHGYYDPHCWSFVAYDDFHHRHGHHGHGRHGYRYRSFDEVGDDLGRGAVVTRPPRVAPRDLASFRSTREAAVRQASADTAARVAAVNPNARPSAQPFTRSERSALAVRRPPAGDRTRVVAPDEGAAQPRTRARGAAAETMRGAPATRSPSASRTAPPSATRRESAAPQPPPAARDVAPRSLVDPREVYRRMATPRTTVRRPAGPQPRPPQAEPQEQPQEPQPQQPSGPRAATRSSGGRRPSAPPPRRETAPAPPPAPRNERGMQPSSVRRAPGPQPRAPRAVPQAPPDPPRSVARATPRSAPQEQGRSSMQRAGGSSRSGGSPTKATSGGRSRGGSSRRR